jgi:hypothetical protein
MIPKTVALACRVRTGHRSTTRVRLAGSAPDSAPPFAESDGVVEDSEVGCKPSARGIGAGAIASEASDALLMKAMMAAKGTIYPRRVPPRLVELQTSTTRPVSDSATWNCCRPSMRWTDR